ncbi:MAG TPA: Rieske 2Fe-2S domain-containing protein [Polyangiaceae bacterium]|nr:Rieske 2Fe-2S domain-containing protein [Polyangiaceae bacterium]
MSTEGGAPPKLVGTLAPEALADQAHVRMPYPPFDVLVAMVEGVPRAIEDACNHAGASLSPGPRTKDGRCVVCPVHGYVFQLVDGKLRSPRGLCGDQRTFEVRREPDGTLSVWDTFDLTVSPTP